MDHFIEYEEIKGLSIADFKKMLDETRGLSVKDLKLSDLVYKGGKPRKKEIIDPGKGVYIFKEGKTQYKYVGKCTSITFVDRIPEHISVRVRSRGYLLKRMIEREDKEVNEENMHEFVHEAIENLSLILIRIYNSTSRKNKPHHYWIKRMERMLRGYLEPCNQYKTITAVKDPSMSVEDYCKKGQKE